MKHIIVYNVREERFALSAEMFFRSIPNCILVEGQNLKSLEFSGLVESWEEYCLHFMCHGSPGSLLCNNQTLISKIGGKLQENKTHPKVIFIYACHAADENGTAKRMYDYYNGTVPLIGIGRCESISMNDENNKAIPAGGPISFMHSLLKSNPTDLLTKMVEEIRSPSICKKESDDIIKKGAAIYDSIEPQLNKYTIEQIFGYFSMDYRDEINILYDWLFQDVCVGEKRSRSEEEKSDDTTTKSPRKKARRSTDGGRQRRRKSPRHRKGKRKSR